MNPDLDRLHPYPFEKLTRLKAGVTPPAGLAPIPLSIGEPKHAAPGFVLEELITHLHGVSAYPATRGTPALRGAVAEWLTRRYGLAPGRVDPDRHILPVNGTREALFAVAQALVDRSRQPLVAMPNPFYQIYEGAALLAGAEPCYLATPPETGFLPDLDSVPESAWSRCQLLYLCNPGNPTGAVLPEPFLTRVLELADRHDFVVAADECYSEIYLDEERPPPGLLEVAERQGRSGFERCLVFNSLSKRSSLPGLRSGFVAGDQRLIERFLLYRTYHGSAMPLHVQAASTKAWGDEAHVRANRQLYRQKFDTVLEILADALPLDRPEGGFFLWPETPVSDTEFTRELFARTNVTVLPGSYLSRPVAGRDPGERRVRIALVAPLEDCVEAAQRIRDFLG